MKYSATNLSKSLFLLLSIFSLHAAFANTLEVGQGQPYTTLGAALQDVSPGDTILVHGGTYAGGLYVENIQGTPDAWITIMAVPGELVIFDGGINAWQFIDGAYLDIRDFVFESQTGNGLNFDDGGTYDTPAHHIKFTGCSFQNINANGNNDFLKLSGLDSFEVVQCTFLNGAAGGSGIDMVGCHDGKVRLCQFASLGANSIQMKGGTRNITVERNFFKFGGERALNIGGSTDLQFFRPIDAPYEAADIKVYSNVFIGSIAPIAFVGCINSAVINNTIYLPTKWVMRILQESVDTTRFAPCGNNDFINNIIYINNLVNVECNIGPNTDPGSFLFSNNMWYKDNDPSWNGPVLPAEDLNSITGSDPLFRDAENEDFSLFFGSLAIGGGIDLSQPAEDHIGNLFSMPRSIGAYEGNPMTDILDITNASSAIQVFPNPVSKDLTVVFPEKINGSIVISMMNTNGQLIRKFEMNIDDSNEIRLDAERWNCGLYYVVIESKMGKFAAAIIKF
jgi:hypothetical protein